MAFSSDSNSAAQVFIEPPPWWTADWDTGVFDTVVVPGYTHVEVDRGPKWDRKPVKGQTGETQTFGGWNNADMKIRIRTWTTAQHEQMLATVIPILEPDPGKDAPKEIGIEHPVAAARKVQSFRVAKLKGPTPNFKDGYTEWEIDAFQAIKKAPAPKGPPGKPGQTQCQQMAAEYAYHVQQEQTLAAYLAQLQVKLASVFGTEEGVTVGNEIEKTSGDMAAERDRARYISENMAAMKCSEQSPSSEAAAGDVPPP